MAESVELPEPSGVVVRNGDRLQVGDHTYNPYYIEDEIKRCLEYVSDGLAMKRFLADELDELIDRARAHAHSLFPIAHGRNIADMNPNAQGYYRAMVRFIQDESK
ncbi:hypothetical protein [Mycobacteroides abscessus]|uniref:hypothetical protein n=1 Tax=Mycobacteroides abscessus TaxID=36809 RepID=UPI00092900D0|nr:hypothetical protein [Mycobacteroides abscessus]SHW53698.1 Uncharacterised protein [Mycobacteroides abscessus subsp. abscessus]SIA40336.1 Uncharacterised protein [Mycobacteroides abscessus subsp. abscessus]SKR77170.1 Uncharacterised protein [Mycobacteroides abscessus subsp. abscessus]